jgi:hypothetical protein
MKLSKTSKLDGILSWSLQAIDTCPGSVGADGSLVPACSGCYATTGFYLFEPAKNARAFNRDDWQREEWADDMVQALESQRYFRWFDSGDVYSAALAQKIYEVIRRTPWCNHWLPSKSYNIPRIRYWLDRIKTLPNASVRYSSPSTHGQYTEEHGSVVVQNVSDLFTGQGVFACEAYTRGGKCGPCRACWDKNVAVVLYPLHTPKKKINIQINRVRKAA